PPPQHAAPPAARRALPRARQGVRRRRRPRQVHAPGPGRVPEPAPLHPQGGGAVSPTLEGGGGPRPPASEPPVSHTTDSPGPGARPGCAQGGIITAIVSPSEAGRMLAKAKALLATASKVEDVKGARDRAASVRDYLQRRGDSLEAQFAAAEIKLRAE